MACALCAEIALVERGESPWAVATLATGHVWISPTQYYRGATFFVSSRCVREVYDLDVEVRQVHLMEMSAVAAAVQRATGARKMNYESLGNGVPHLHWWLTPRHDDDPRPRGPIWEDLDFLRLLWTSQGRPTEAEAAERRSALLDELRKDAIDISVEHL
jgi:diadenosine tetraphosphate (Ap4A) HIT family hydrolase